MNFGAEHRYACALRCVANALKALEQDTSPVQRHAAALWVERAAGLLREAPTSAGEGKAETGRLALAAELIDEALASMEADPAELRNHAPLALAAIFFPRAKPTVNQPPRARERLRRLRIRPPIENGGRNGRR